MESGIYAFEDDKKIPHINIIFGGKIGVGIGCNENYTGVVLTELPSKQEIDVNQPEVDAYNQFSISLLFDNPKSIDVMIKALQGLKDTYLIRKHNENKLQSGDF